MAVATLGELIRTARKIRGLTALDLALQIGVTQATISRLENDDYAQAPKPEIMQGLSRILGIPEVELLRSVGYHINEGTPSYDETASTISRAVRDWTPRQKKLLMDYIDVVSEALDSYDPPLDDERSATGAA